ncbi:MAG TPA: hypothetical protein VFW83_03390, partial [Bryobacteraceae bacterium]|nr:hypothetical protein [Bryobacteraceae bacterium]
NVGPVTFYVAGNSVDNPFSDVADAGDHVYTNKYVLTAAAETCSLSTPVITSVISASGFGALNTFAPGSWLEVYGTNLAPDTRPWGGSDFNGANAPTALDGVSVSIGGKPGFVYYIANSQINSQINVQAPAGTATGPAAVTVTNCAGTSAPYVINEAKFAPGVLAPPSFNIGGKQYMVAVRSCNPACTYIGKPDQPAKPGDTIVAYGIGFGDVTPSSPPGIVVGPTELNRLANPLTILFGQTPAAAPAYFGLAPNFVGLYQFNITVPDVPDGDVPVTFEVGGVQTTQTMYVTVHR